jgi:hypothetical protein
MRTHKDLQVWQKAIDLAKRVYAVTSHFPRREAYGLAAQMRKTAVSIPSKPGGRVSRFSASGRSRVSGPRYLTPELRIHILSCIMHPVSCIHFLTRH